MNKNEINPGEPIAIIGMGCWYPGARDLKQLWENILARRQQFRRMPDQRLPLSEYHDADPGAPEKTYGSRAAVIDGFEFDWAKRMVPQITYDSTDITHWLALEVALKALDDAGYTRSNVATERSGVVLGNTLTGEVTRANTMRQRWPFVRRALLAAAKARGISQIMPEFETTMEHYFKSVFAPTTEDSLAGGLSNTIAGRVCNFLNFHGGGYTVDGACSSSLIAVATAATALANRDMDLVLAGGVDISLDTFELIGFAKTRALTKTDMTVYDQRASGFIPGEGCGFVALKRLSDARADGNKVLAVLRGWGLSSDGKGGLTAPSKEGQAKALRRAYERAGYPAREVTFFEGHGTGTPLGDRVEVEGIRLATGNDQQAQLRMQGLTSFKSIVGHTKAAAGIGGFIKAVMAVNRRVVPPTAGCKNPHAVFEHTAPFLYPVLQGQVLDCGTSIRAGVSAMGFGGINCHVTLESGDAPASLFAPSVEERALLVTNQDTEVFVLAADSINSLIEAAQALHRKAFGMSMGEMSDLAAMLAKAQMQPPQQAIRAAIIATSPEQLLELINELISLLRTTPPPAESTIGNAQNTLWVGNGVHQCRVGMLFPGQGSQQLNMARVLVERYDWARAIVSKADAAMNELGLEPISPLMLLPLDRSLGSDDIDKWAQALAQTQVAQPAICLAGLLWWHYLARLGIEPVSVGGHSLGELGAFFAAGVYDETALIKLAALRGQAMAAPCTQAGSMASLGCAHDIATNLLKTVDGYVVIANLNSPRQSVISGEASAVEQVVALAKAAEIPAQILPVSNAFHSEFVASASNFLSKLDRATAPIAALMPPAKVKLLSGMAGSTVHAGMPLHEHFERQIQSQIDFITLAKSMAQTCDLMIEVGPGRVLSGLVRDIVGPNLCLPLESRPGVDRDINTIMARLFIQGAKINWHALYENRLIRDFVPASARKFIVNPCERPFTPLADQAPIALPGVPGEGILESMLLNGGGDGLGIAPQVLTEYLARRSRFIAGVIRADLQDVPAPSQARQPQASPAISTPPQHQAVLAPTAAKTVAATILADSANSVETRLIARISERTGYPVQGILHDARLLDDLNLDSIKAGELIASIASEFGVAGEVDPVTLANASIREIGNLIRSVAPATATALATAPALTMAAGPSNDVAGLEFMLLELVAGRTGFDLESLTSDMRLLDDLNLDSIKAGELIAEAALRLKVQGAIDPANFANASLAEIAATLHSARSLQAAPVEAKKSGVVTAPQESASSSTWVRNFATRLVAQELHIPDHFSWSEAQILILHESSELAWAQHLRDAWRSAGAHANMLSYEQAQQQNQLANPLISHFVAILPTHAPTDADQQARLQRMLARLASIATPPTNHPAHEKTTLTWLGFGGENKVLEQSCASAFAASVHLERSDLRVRVIDCDAAIDMADFINDVLAELSTPEGFVSVVYGRDLVRRVPRQVMQESISYPSRNLRFAANEVMLVTGGAKGITAQCALALAQTIRVRTALVGSSPGSSPHSDQNQAGSGGAEIAETMARFTAAGLVVQYYQCDIGDAAAVHALVQQVRQELGPIAAVVHGAGINRPNRIERTSVQSALAEVSPKVLGAQYLCQALHDAPPKLLAGLTSIIGVSGMPGNAWYGFSNEALNLILQDFARQHTQTQIISMAFSIWGEVGMGARMGSTHALAKMGIAAIPTDEGVRRFVQLATCDPGEAQVVVSARLGGLDTWQYADRPLPEAKRYLEHIVSFHPDIELVAQAHLTLAHDAYVKDHIYKGSALFPTVFGLEAMAQAVAFVSGRQQFGALRIENIHLDRPIVLDPVKGVTIQIHAQMLERSSTEAQQRVQVGISTEQSSFLRNHFSATFVLDAELSNPNQQVTIAPVPLDIEPKQDLYSWLLFQGPLFQRLEKIHSLASNTCIFSSEVRPYHNHDGTTDGIEGPFILGDPYFRDSLLQAPQLTISQDICLPIYIDSLELSGFRADAPGSRNAVGVLEGVQGRKVASHAFALDDQGRVVERLNGYQLQILEHLETNPTPDQIAAPTLRDTALLSAQVKQLAQQLNLRAPELALAYDSLHPLSRALRHEREKPLFAQALRSLLPERPTVPEIVWIDDKRPTVADEGGKIGVSLSHDERICLCVAGYGEQGCDITPVMDSSGEEWIALLGHARQALLQKLINHKDPLALAGTRIWAAVEALRKTGHTGEITLDIESQIGRHVLFSCNQQRVLTLPIMLTRGPERMVAVVLHDKREQASQTGLLAEAAPAQSVGSSAPVFAEFDKSVCTVDKQMNGPQLQAVVTWVFPLTFRDTANLSRTLYFTHYSNWMGKLRELACQPVLDFLVTEFETGKWGMVTNNAETIILGHATSADVVSGSAWMEKLYGRENSTMDICYEWSKRLADGSLQLIAISKMTTTWVAILEHGIVEVRPLPEHFQQGIVDMMPQAGTAPSTWQMPERVKLGRELCRIAPGPGNKALLREQFFDTALEESNLVGNVYYANYYVWQGRIINQFFYQIAPAFYRGVGEQGEFRCTLTKVDHLREAMPFDRIAVKMSLGAIYECGVQLLFDYYKVNEDGSYMKLATGEHQAAWFIPSGANHGEQGALPEVFRNALLLKAGISS